MRNLHEASLHKHNLFGTFTLSDENIPEGGSLDHRQWQLFVKRLRKKTGGNIAYYMGGEYGRTNPKTGIKDGGFYRPHYHAIIFNLWPEDTKYWTTRNGYKNYKSAELEKVWGLGQTEFGQVTFESAAYVTGYTQHLNGKEKAKYGDRLPEYNKMSLNPAIGKRWLEKYKTDVFPHDYVVINGKETKPPRYYDELFKRNNPDAWRKIALNRELDAQERAHDNTPDRLAAKEQVLIARQKQKERE